MVVHAVDGRAPRQRMTTGEPAIRSDFVQPIRGLCIWRRAAKRLIVNASLGIGRPIAPDEDPGREATAPDFFEPVLGWRIWRAVKCDGRYVLASIFMNVAWVPGRSFDAHCHADPN